MQRAKTVTGLFFHLLRTRWSALGSPAKALAIAGLILAAAFALKATCLFGCPAAASPCQLRAPCQRSAMVQPAVVEPAAPVAEHAAPAADVPPCHR